MASLMGHAPLLLAALGGAAVAATAILLYNRSTERQAAKEALSPRRATRRNVSPHSSPRSTTTTVDSTTAEREGRAHRGHPPLATLHAHEQAEAVHGHDALVAEPVLDRAARNAAVPSCGRIGRNAAVRASCRACSESDDDDEAADVMPPYTDMTDGESGISTASSNVYYTNIPSPVAPSFTGGTTASTTSSNARSSSSSSSSPSPSPSPPPPPRTALQLRVARSHWTPPPPPLPPTGPGDAGDGPPSFRLPSSPRAWQYDHAAQWLRDLGTTAGLDDGVRLRLARNITDGKHLLGLQSVDDILKLIGVQGWSKGDVRWVLREANAEGVDPQFEAEVAEDVRPVIRGVGVAACILHFLSPVSLPIGITRFAITRSFRNHPLVSQSPARRSPLPCATPHSPLPRTPHPTPPHTHTHAGDESVLPGHRVSPR